MEIEGEKVTGVARPLVLHQSMIKEYDLRPGMCVESGNNSAFNLRLRAYLARFPDAFWVDPKKVVRHLSLGKDPKVLVVSTAFEHVVGPEQDRAPWDVLPSASPVYRSLARALVKGDAKAFKPGKSNLDWRLHAQHEGDEG